MILWSRVRIFRLCRICSPLCLQVMKNVFKIMGLGVCLSVICMVNYKAKEVIYDPTGMGLLFFSFCKLCMLLHSLKIWKQSKSPVNCPVGHTAVFLKINSVNNIVVGKHKRYSKPTNSYKVV